jgi:hypothetical protein
MEGRFLKSLHNAHFIKSFASAAGAKWFAHPDRTAADRHGLGIAKPPSEIEFFGAISSTLVFDSRTF